MTMICISLWTALAELGGQTQTYSSLYSKIKRYVFNYLAYLCSVVYSGIAWSDAATPAAQ